MTVIAGAFMLAGLMIGSEFRLVIERSADETFRVTSTSLFMGLSYLPKTIEGVKEVASGDEVMPGRSYAPGERARLSSQKHLRFDGGGRSIKWDGEDDYVVVSNFMRSKDPTLALADRPSNWRVAGAWFCLLFGAWAFLGGIQNSFFPKKKHSSTGR